MSKIKITEGQLRKIVNESINQVLESTLDKTLRVEDFFDIDSLSKKDILSMATDLRIYIGTQGFNSDLTENGELVITEGIGDTMPIGQLRQGLKKLGFKQWQIKSEVVANKVRIVILFAGIGINADIIVNKMLAFGWTKSRISGPNLKYGVPVMVMEFDPKDQKSLSDEARRYMYLYHITPYRNLNSILKNGIEARSENDFLSFPPKAHVIKGDIPRIELSKLGWMLFRINSRVMDGHYAVIRITTSKVPKDVDFYGDPRFTYGYFTKKTIPPESLELFGDVTYNDKFNFKNENINVIVQDDTMAP